MKLSLLDKQLKRFLQYGITDAELRLGYFQEWEQVKLDESVKAIKKWINKRKGEHVGDTEISVKPCLPKCWDSNAF
jgi:hypothetical protein